MSKQEQTSSVYYMSNAQYEELEKLVSSIEHHLHHAKAGMRSRNRVSALSSLSSVSTQTRTACAVLGTSKPKLQPDFLVVGGTYRFKHEKDILTYIGKIQGKYHFGYQWSSTVAWIEIPEEDIPLLQVY